MRSRPLLVCVALLAVVMAGCQKTTADPTVPTTVSPSVSVSPSSSVSSGTPTPSKIAGYDAAKVAEAEKIFKEYAASFIAAQVAGGSASLPVDMKPLVAPPNSTDTQQVLAKQKLDGWRLVAPPQPVVSVRGPLAGVGVPGSEVSLSACIDYTGNTVRFASGAKRAGIALEYRAFFKTVEGSLRYFRAQTKQVTKC